MSEYNKLTQRLLAEGYTADNYPDYVKIGGGNFGKGDPLDNFYGGFEYTREYREKMVFVTGCGLFVEGKEIGFGSMSFNGIEWTAENDCPVITCPLRPDSCDKRFSQSLGGAHGGGLCKIFQCDLRQTDEPYDYERSIRKVKNDIDAEQHRQLEEYIRRKKGHYCVWHAHYNYWSKTWKQVYNPIQCARMCQNIGKTCDLSGKEISKKRGNVFYDVKVSWIHNEGDLFDGQEEVHITRGVRFLDHPTSVTICEQIAKRCRQDIIDREIHRRHTEIYLNGIKVEVLNIRVEQRESRDLLQDLEDLKAGIEIRYDSDDKKAIKEAKSARRKEAKEAKVRKIEKKILDVGYDNLEDDRYKADRLLTPERIEELEEERKRILIEKENDPKQMSLFDLEGFV
jgi:hypothetical protein